VNIEEQTNRQLDEVIADLNVSDRAKRVLHALARDGYGVDRDHAPHVLASTTNLTFDQCSQAIIELTSKQLLVAVDLEDNTRLAANYEKLGIDERTRQVLLAKARPITDLGAPHSPVAMSTLQALLQEEPNPIYIGLEVTSPVVFSKLVARSEMDRQTIFILPRKKDVRSDLQRHYDETMAEWLTLIGQGPARLKRTTRILVTRRSFPMLYTSALTKGHARLDIYSYDRPSTREGFLIRVDAGTSLYDLIEKHYELAVHSASPLWAIWKLDWFKAFLRRYWLPLAALVAGALATWVSLGLAQIAAGLLLGALGQLIYDVIQWTPGRPIRLYKR
jgi:hypothetical protein